MQPLTLTDPDAAVEATLSRVGKRIVLGTPLGIGKPNLLLNAFFRRAAGDASIRLRILTALSLEKPVGHSDLERRFLEPFVARVFGDYPELDYMQALRAGRLPSNIEVSEFYFKSGSLLDVAAAQQNYMSVNYTHVARAMLAAGMNVIAQAVAKEERPWGLCYSLSSNPDVTLDVMPGFAEARAAGRSVAVVGMVNRRLPYMYGDAEVDPDFFDVMVDNPALDHHLFAIPNMAIDPVSHAIGLHASTLVQDGGTVQVGIGSLGDAFVHAARLRHGDNAAYLDALNRFGIEQKFGDLIDAVGAVEPFEQGLYAGSEMFGDGLLHLYEAGILKRRVYDHEALQQLLNEGRISESVGPETLTALVDAGAIQSPLTTADVDFLQHFGILRPDVKFEGAMLVLPDGSRLVPDLENRDTLRKLVQSALGARLTNGVLVHGAFFLGSQWFYDSLHRMPEPERHLFAMEAVSTVNELFSDVALESLQHRRARFFNICMKMTLLGAAVSDGLEDGRVVSGVGGQYNFVAMAHALKEARSVLMLKSTHESRGQLESNIVWNYGHCTIPRHLRDMVVTEYGIADLRGKPDKDVIAAMLNIADSRFQEGLLAEAKRNGKIAKDYRIPEAFCNNTPDALRKASEPLHKTGVFPDFPFGHEFTPEELALGKALKWLEARSRNWTGKLSLARSAIWPARTTSMEPYLARIGLNKPAGIKERALANLIAKALQRTGTTG